MPASSHRRPLSEQDQAEWHAFAATIRPLPGRAVAPPPVLPPPSPPPVLRPPRAERRAPLAPLAIGQPPAGLDAASWERLRSGRLLPQRALDLHGRTAAQAHLAFQAFVAAASADALRCVEIITGRGRGEGQGVLRREFGYWLNDPAIRPLLLAAAYAYPANAGAVRLLLRRRR